MIVHRLDDTASVRRDYASLDRLQMRRLDRTGRLRFDELDQEQTLLAAVAACHPMGVLDVGCGDGRIPSLYAAPEVLCVERHFARVTRLIRGGAVLWPLRAPDGPYPFVSTRAKCVFVAEAA